MAGKNWGLAQVLLVIAEVNKRFMLNIMLRQIRKKCNYCWIITNKNEQHSTILSFFGSIFLISIIYFLHHGVLKNFFLSDDFAVLYFVDQNSHDTILKMFTHTWLGRYYRPIPQIIFTFIYRVFGTNPFPYYLINLLFHFANTLFLLFLSFKLYPKRSSSISRYTSVTLAVLLFAIHPRHSGTVSYISALPDLLVTFFYLVAFLCFVHFLEKRVRGWLLVSAASFIFASLSKEMAFSLPLVLLSYLIIFRLKEFGKNFWLVAPYILVVIGVIAIRLSVQTYDFQQLFQGTKFDIWGRLYSASKAISALIIPGNVDLSILKPIFLKYHILVYLFVACVILLIVMVLKLVQMNRNLLFSLVFILLTLIPPLIVFQGVSLIGVENERYIYLPSVGLSLLLLHTSFRKRKIFLCVMLGVILFYSYSLYLVNSYWIAGSKMSKTTMEELSRYDYPQLPGVKRFLFIFFNDYHGVFGPLDYDVAPGLKLLYNIDLDASTAVCNLTRMSFKVLPEPNFISIKYDNNSIWFAPRTKKSASFVPMRWEGHNVVENRELVAVLHDDTISPKVTVTFKNGTIIDVERRQFTTMVLVKLKDR